MSRISELFSHKPKNILNVYCTAGFPHFKSTTEVLKALRLHGADIAEIGMPYSDPIVDGPTIQHSNTVALQNGMTIQHLFSQLMEYKNVSKGAIDNSMPIILMGSLNPVMQYGIEKFCKAAKEAGIDGIILPEIPLFEYENEYQSIFKAYELNFIFLITPETTEERIRKIDDLSNGFVYAVSSSSTTGKTGDLHLQQAYLKKLQAMNLKNPVLVGFGIKDKKTFDAACEYTNGAIIGTAYIKALEKSDDINNTTMEFLNGILK